MKRTDEQRRNRAVRVTEGLLRWLGIWQQYSVAFKFAKTLPASAATASPGANVVTHYPYQMVEITFDRAQFDKASDYQLEALVRHEALHIPWAELNKVLDVVDGITQAERDALSLCEERIVDLTSHLLDRVRPPWGYHPSGVPWPHNPKRKKG